MSCANSWRRIEALGWFDFGYPHWIVYLLAGAFGSFGSYMYIQAEFELRKHNHGATGLGAFRPWPGRLLATVECSQSQERSASSLAQALR